MITWRQGPLKYWLKLNDSGIWGEDPTGQDDVRVVRSTDIRLDGSWSLENVAERSVPIAERAAKQLVLGDLVVVKSSGSVDHLGKTAIVDSQTAALRPCFANFVQRLRPTSSADSRYVWYVLNSRQAATEMEVLGNATTGLRNLNGSIIGSVTFPGPPLAAQRVIANFLDAEINRIDGLIAKNRQMIGLLVARRYSIAIGAVSGKLVHGGDMTRTSIPWLEERPIGWDAVLLRLVAKLGSGHTPSRDHPEWWLDCTIPWITTGEVHRLRSDRVEHIEQTREMISEIGLSNSAAELHPANTVVLCRTASAGYSGIMKQSMATSQDFATWECGPLLRPRFLLLCLRAMRNDLLGRLAMGSTHKTIYMPDIRSIRIPLPPVGEQDRIVDAVWREFTKIDQAMTLTEGQIALLQERRQALITAAVTGEMAVPGVST